LVGSLQLPLHYWRGSGSSIVSNGSLIGWKRRRQQQPHWFWRISMIDMALKIPNRALGSLG
jgi:hypothetical protein